MEQYLEVLSVLSMQVLFHNNILHITYVQNLCYGAVSGSLVSFVNSSLLSLSYGAVSGSLVSFVNVSIISQCSLYNILHITYVQNLSYGAVSGSLVSFVNSSLLSLSYGAVCGS